MRDPDWPEGRDSRARPSLARPYSWTAGRTEPTMELPIEALVQTTPAGHRLPYHRTDVRSVLVQLCREPRSTAEIAAHLTMPLGVARVLISDLLSSGLVTVHDTLDENSTWDERHDLLERVLSGLRAI